MSDKSVKSCAIVLNGESIEVDINDTFVICADGGANILKSRKPDIILGDGDSLNIIPKDVEFVKFPIEKNETDGEICIEYAVKKGYKNLNLYGVLGGRTDHILGNFALLAYADKLGAKAVAREKGLDIYFAKGEFKLATNKNDTISVVPFGGIIVVEHSVNLHYPLENLCIEPYQSRGISNLATSNSITLNFSVGEAIVFHYHK